MQSKGYSTRRKESAAVILFLLGSITAWVLYAGELGPPEHRDFSLVAALQAQSPAGATSPAERPTRIDRTPLRILEDSYPAFSGVAAFMNPASSSPINVTMEIEAFFKTCR